MAKVTQFIRDGMTGFVNRVTGAGTRRDPTSHSKFVFVKPGAYELESIYRANWIAAKIVNIPVSDMLRQGWTWTADEAKLSQLEAEEKRLGFKAKLRQVLTRDAVYGGAALFVGTEDNDLSSELRVDRMGRGSIKYLTPFHSADLRPMELSRDPQSLGQPKMFQLNDEGNNQLNIHPSRVLTFRARPTDKPLGTMTTDDWWGDSRLANVLSDIAAAASALNGGSRLMGELAVWIYKINGMADTLAQVGGEEQVQKLLNLNMTMKSSLNAIAVDKEDDVDIITANLAGISESVRSFMQNVAGAADIPYTRFMSASPDGMNATGDSDLRNYYDRLVSDRENYVEGEVTRFDQMLIRSATGTYSDDVYRTWKPLWQMNESQQTELDAKKMTMLGQILDKGIVHDHVVESVAKNIMVDSPTFPGAEVAFDEAEKMPDPRDEEVEDATGLSGQPAAKNPAQPQQKPKLRLVKDMEPRPLYVRRDVLNAKQILAHFERQGVQNLYRPSDLHVTILYSKTPVDWMKMGSYYPGDDGKMIVPPGGPRYVSVFGEGALVQEFVSYSLQWRHEEMIGSGATSDYPEYRAHITISLDAGVDPDTIESYQGPIELGPEIFEDLDENWKASLTSDEMFEDKFNESAVNRYPAGSGKGGQFAPKGAGGGAGGGKVKHGYAAAYTKAQKAHASAKAEYLHVMNDKSSSQEAKKAVADKLIAADKAKKQALKDYYANKGSKAAAKQDTPTPEKPKGLSKAEREAGIAAVKKEKSAALKEYKSHPAGSAEKKAALAVYNAKAAEQKKMEAGLEKYQAALAGAASQMNAGPASSNSSPAKPKAEVKAPTKSVADQKHAIAIDATVKAHPHPTFGKAEVEKTIQKGLSGQPLGYNEQKLFNTYMYSMNPTAKQHPSTKPVQPVELKVTTNFKEAMGHTEMKSVMDNYSAALASKGKYSSSKEHLAYISKLTEVTKSGELAHPDKDQKSYADFGQLTSDQKAALKMYTGSDYSAINNHLRFGQKAHPDVTANIAKMDEAFTHAKAKTDFVVQRGLAPDAVKKYMDAGQFKVGATMIDRGFVSTTSKHGTASSFNKDNGYHMVIRVKKGQSIAPLKSLSKYRDENEFLLPRNTAFQIQHIDETAKIVVVDVL